MDSNIINAEVISVYPNKIKVSVDNLETFKVDGQELKVGSYLRIADNENAILIAIIENFSIEVGVDKDQKPTRKYLIEANPLGILRGDEFQRGGDSLAIPPKKVEPAKPEEIDKIYQNSIEQSAKYIFSSLSSNPNIKIKGIK